MSTYDKDQMFADIKAVAAKALEDGEKKDKREIKMLIKVLKAHLTMQMGETLSQTVATHALIKPDIGKHLRNGTEIVVQLADFFELIAEREWLDEPIPE